MAEMSFIPCFISVIKLITGHIRHGIECCRRRPPRSYSFLVLTCGVVLHLFGRCIAISPACECVFFDGFGYLSNGTFMSPNFPERYEPNTHCILYTFVGRQGELIALTFNYFELQQPDEAGKCSDYVKLYQDLEQPAVNEDSAPQETICGHVSPPAKTFYSRGRALIFEFHSDDRITDHDKGFSGEFRFLRQRDFQTDGEKIDPNSLCDYHIHSAEVRSGKIFSPDYPYFYTPNKNCHFWFTGRVGEHVKITVVTTDLTPTGGSCITADDSISIYDGPGPRMGHGDGIHGDLLLGHYCGKSFISETVTTSSEMAFLRFNAGANTRRQGRGFYATFQFYKHPLPLEKPSSVPLLGRKDEHAPPCDFEYSSENKTHGIVTSPGYPFQYPPNLRCTYTFRSTGIERVQIVFTDFDLYYPEQPDKPQSQCRGEFDHLTAYVDLDGRMSEINTFCSTETPPQLMSSKNLMTLEFITNANPTVPNRVYRGFKFRYRFVKNFGITSGQKDPQYVCGFIYNGSISNNGTIYSPNYPGYYPRKTVCHFTFRGAQGEKVRIFFTYFDVDGMGQCDNESSSDYLEFSNYNTIDLRLPKFCGARAPPKDGMESEQDYYHLTFYSNAIFDGTGFFGFYQFVKTQEKGALKKVKLDVRGASVSRIRRPVTTTALFLSLCCVIHLLHCRLVMGDTLR